MKITLDGETLEILDRAAMIDFIQNNWRCFLRDLAIEDSLCQLVERGELGIAGGPRNQNQYLEEMKNLYDLLNEALNLDIYEIRETIKLLSRKRDVFEGHRMGVLTRKVHRHFKSLKT